MWPTDPWTRFCEVETVLVKMLFISFTLLLCAPWWQIGVRKPRRDHQAPTRMSGPVAAGAPVTLRRARPRGQCARLQLLREPLGASSSLTRSPALAPSSRNMVSQEDLYENGYGSLIHSPKLETTQTLLFRGKQIHKCQYTYTANTAQPLEPLYFRLCRGISKALC